LLTTLRNFDAFYASVQSAVYYTSVI
jgi:hypothetical protein